MIVIRILFWALIFVIKLQFPPALSIVNVLKKFQLAFNLNNLLLLLFLL